MNEEIERMLLIAYSMGVDNTKWADSGEDKTSLQQAKEWLDTAKWDGTLEQSAAMVASDKAQEVDVHQHSKECEELTARASRVAREVYVRCDDEPVMFYVKARQQGVTAAKYKVARRLIIDKLQSWGEWRVKSNIKTPTKTYNPDDEVMAEGYDHALLSDFDSAMIVIDAAIGNLNKIDRVMLELEYSREYKDPLKQWNNEMKASRSQSTYDNRLRGLQLDPRIIKACGY